MGSVLGSNRMDNYPGSAHNWKILAPLNMIGWRERAFTLESSESSRTEAFQQSWDLRWKFAAHLRYLAIASLHAFQSPFVASLQPGVFRRWGFPVGSVSKESASSAGDMGLIPGSGRPPGEGNGNSLLGSSSIPAWEIAWTAWQATVNGGHKKTDTTEQLNHHHNQKTEKQVTQVLVGEILRCQPKGTQKCQDLFCLCLLLIMT